MLTKVQMQVPTYVITLPIKVVSIITFHTHQPTLAWVYTTLLSSQRGKLRGPSAHVRTIVFVSWPVAVERCH